MKHLKSLNHIGYAVKSIDDTAAPYIKAGWSLSEIFEEKVQNTRIAFLKKQGFPTIELVSPPIDGSKSPVDIYLNKIGVTQYHLCYDVDDIDAAVGDLYEEGFMPLFMPVESNAMDNHKICYLFHNDIGLIEIVD